MEDSAHTEALVPIVKETVHAECEDASTQAGVGVLSIQYHTLAFNESQSPSNPNWVRETKVITPPSGWRQVSVSVSSWDFDLFPRERPLTYFGAQAGVRLTGSTLEVLAYAICRDTNADDPWKGRIRVQVIFTG